MRRLAGCVHNMGCNQATMDVLPTWRGRGADEIYANIQRFIDSDTCCNYQFNINYCSAMLDRSTGPHQQVLTRRNFDSTLSTDCPRIYAQHLKFNNPTTKKNKLDKGQTGFEKKSSSLNSIKQMAAVMKYISNTQSEMNETWEGVALSHCRIW